MCLESDAKACLLIEARLRFRELVALVLEHALEHVPLKDCLLAFGGTSSLLGQQAEEHPVVLNEQRIATGEDRECSDLRLVHDRDRETGRLALDRLIAQGGRVADGHGHRWRAGDRSQERRVARGNDCPPGAGDLHRRVGEGLPQRFGCAIGRPDQRLSEVECRGALLESTQGLRRHERHEVGQSRGEREQPRDHDPRCIGRFSGRGGRAGDARDQDRGGEEERPDGRDPQASACIADPVLGGAPEQDRPDALEEHETPDDQARRDQIPARADGVRNDQRADTRGQRYEHEVPSHRHEVAD